MDDTVTIEIKANEDWRKVGTVQGVAREIAKMDPSANDYMFRLQAKLKRLVHHEKHSVYSRLEHYGNGATVDWLLSIAITPKVETHKRMSGMADEDIITWDVDEARR